MRFYGHTICVKRIVFSSKRSNKSQKDKREVTADNESPSKQSTMLKASIDDSADAGGYPIYQAKTRLLKKVCDGSFRLEALRLKEEERPNKTTCHHYDGSKPGSSEARKLKIDRCRRWKCWSYQAPRALATHVL